MARDDLIVGVDIGSSKIAVCVAKFSEEGLQIVGFAHVPHSGLRKGAIDDVEDTVSVLSQALEDAERMVGLPITHALVSINGPHTQAAHAKGVIAISKPTGEIDQNDVLRVIDAAKTVALPQNRELIHIFPHFYSVDGQDEIRDPVGISGIRLEVEALVISGGAAAVRNLGRAVTQSGLEADGMVFGILAASKFLTTKNQRENGVMVIDLGAGTTSFAVYEEGQLIHCGCLPIGSKHITNDIAIGLRKNLDIADLIKTKYGTVLPDTVRESESINLAALDPVEDEKVSRRQVAEIIEARMIEIFAMIKKELEEVGREGVLPAGAIFTGGGSDLEGLTELARKHLRLPAQVGFPNVQISGMIDKIDNPVYATSVGLVLWAIEEGRTPNVHSRFNIDKLGGVFGKFRGFLRNITN